MAKEHKRAAKDKHKSKKKQSKPTAKDKPTTTEKLKELSTQSGPAAMAATPTQQPVEPADADSAVYGTGPGQVVGYNYDRVEVYPNEYQQQYDSYQVAGPGGTLTSGSVAGQ